MPEDVSHTIAALCGGCRSGGACRLGIGDLIVQNRSGRANARCPSTWHGGPGIAHGGWVAAALDDFAGRMLGAAGTFVVTGTLTITYLKPTPAETDLILTGEAEAEGERRWKVSARIALAAAPDQPLAEAIAQMIEPRPGHYDRHIQRMSELRGAAD